MALTLNTSHPLYGNLIEAVGIDSGALKALVNTSKTFTPAAGTSYVSGTYGNAFKTVKNGYTPAGATMSPAINTDTSVTPNLTIVAVFNNLVVGDGNGAFVAGTLTGGAVANLTINSAGKFEVTDNNNGIVATSNGTITGTHSVAVTRTGETGGALYIDGTLDKTFTSMLSWNGANRNYNVIGGTDGFGSTSVELVWLFVFNKVLTATEISNLHSSLGASNTMASNGQTALVENSGAVLPTVSSVTVAPATQSVTGGATQQFAAVVAGTNNPGQGVTWSFTPAAAGASISAGGLFTAPAATASQQTFTITATSTVDNTKSGSATATVPATGAPPVTYTGVSVTPSTATVVGLATQQFSATVSGTGAFSTAVTWSVDGAGNGTINSSGLYTAPAAGVSARNVVVRATAANGTTSGTAAVTVPAAAGTGSFTSARFRNGSGGYQVNQSVRYEWHPGARIGQSSGNAFQEGVGTTDSQGRLAMTGLTAGTGYFLFARWNNGVTDDHVSFQAGTVS